MAENDEKIEGQKDLDETVNDNLVARMFNEEDMPEESMEELQKAFEELDNRIDAPILDENFDFGELSGGDLDLGDFGSDMGDLSEAELDAMLKSVMEQEEEQHEEWVPRNDLDSALEHEPEVYEGKHAGEEIDLSILVSNKKQSFSIKDTGARLAQQFKEGDRGTKILMSSIGGMSLLTIASFVTLIIVFFSGGANDNNAFAIAPPQYAFNNASHSFINLTAVMGEESITINRLLLDEAATSFYFSGILEPGRFIFHMEDSNGRVYGRDIVFSHNSHRDLMLNQTVVRFEALDADADGFVLSVTDLLTGTTIPIEMTFDSENITLGRYISEPVEIETGIPGIYMSIDHGIFSASGTSLNFSVRSDFDDAGLAFGSDRAPIVLRQGGLSVPPIGDDFGLSYFPESRLLLGSIDFVPLRTLIGRADIVFGDLYMRYGLDMRVNVSDIITTGARREMPINLGGHIVTIEGMMRQGGLFVMPMHGLQRVLEYDDEEQLTENLVRIPTNIVVYLVGTDANGQEQRLEATVRYGRIGTDVLFDDRETGNFEGIPSHMLHLEIQDILLYLPDIVVSIDLEYLGFDAPAETNDTVRQIENLFTLRSGDFAAQHGVSRAVEHRVQLRQMHEDGNRVYAIVVEKLTFVDGSELQEIIREHAAVIENGVDIVQITTSYR